MKFFKRLLLGFGIVIGLLAIASFFLGRSWGRDVDTLKVQEGALQFTAERNSVGVWKIHAKTPNDYYFAVGYVHALDREFQTELVRSVATGQLSAIFGSSLLSRDRLMRLSSEVARAEWDELVKTHSPVVAVLENYVAGRQAYMKKPTAALPIEYRVFKLKREDFKPWQPWEVLAVSRFHSWEFSYDLRDEINTQGYRKWLGPELTDLFFPAEPLDSKPLYAQDGLKPYVKTALRSGFKLPEPALFQPDLPIPAKAPAGEDPKVEKTSQSMGPQRPLFDEMGFLSFLGASNLWLVADPRIKRSPTLCNDTHLGLNWPSPLYPMEYEIEEVFDDDGKAPPARVSGAGFSLPGVPMLTIGKVDRFNEGQSDASDNLAWAITLANYADVQDLIQVSPETLKKAVRQAESFIVRDPKTGKKEEKIFEEQWTEFGPRVDELIKWNGAEPTSAVALDWLGYRKTHLALEFFRRRNLFGSREIRHDLAEHFEYPSVNFTWIERAQNKGDEQMRFGHVLTGLVFDRVDPQSRRKYRELLTEHEARRRRLSQPSERPYLDVGYDEKEPVYFVSANQRVFQGDLAHRLAFQWVDGMRAQRILDSFDKNSIKPEYSQTDDYSPDLVSFLHSARALVDSNRLCGNQSSEDARDCTHVVSSMDEWDGRAEREAWEPTLANLWIVKFKQKLWPAALLAQNKDAQELFKRWVRSNGSDRAARDVFSNEKARSEWEKITSRSLSDAVIDSFRESYALLKEKDPDPSRWAWGVFHRIEWQHPFGLIPGELGPVLRDSTLGPGPSVTGGTSSPQVMSYNWDPKAPLDFPVNHAAVMRMCTSFDDSGASHLRWANSTGVSGNPFSKWAWVFARDYYFEGRLFDENESPSPASVTN